MQNVLLLIEDEPLLAELARTVGENSGYHVELADELETINDALSLLPSVVLMDLNLPSVRPDAIFRTLNSSGCRAHIIIASGAGPCTIDAAVREARDTGLNVCMGIPKPFDIEKLETVLKDLRLT